MTKTSTAAKTNTRAQRKNEGGCWFWYAIVDGRNEGRYTNKADAVARIAELTA